MKKRIALCLSLLLTGVLLYSCEKETFNMSQTVQTKDSTSNPDKILVQDPNNSEWITLSEYNGMFPNTEKAPTYGKRMCIIVNSDGSESVGEVCALCPYTGCTGVGDCVPNR